MIGGLGSPGRERGRGSRFPSVSTGLAPFLLLCSPWTRAPVNQRVPRGLERASEPPQTLSLSVNHRVALVNSGIEKTPPTPADRRPRGALRTGRAPERSPHL